MNFIDRVLIVTLYVLGSAELPLKLVFGVVGLGAVASGVLLVVLIGVGGRILGVSISIVVVPVLVEPAAESIELEDERAPFDGES